MKSVRLVEVFSMISYDQISFLETLNTCENFVSQNRNK